jgi:flagellin-like protein
MGVQHRVSETDAQSEVIGVILMVAIVVVLAAVIGTFALGFGEVSRETPQASFSFDYDDSANELTITHESGDVLDRSAVEVVSNDGSASTVSSWPNTEIVAGDQFVAGSVSPDETVRVVWNADSGGESATLAKWTGPDA